MILSTPTSPATWLFTALTMIDIPIQVYQLFDPESTMQRFQVNPVASRLIGQFLQIPCLIFPSPSPWTNSSDSNIVTGN
jgi:hypothetical protein